ncbi:hypothetical protein D3C85_1671240 [compost metagenome]
MAALSAQLAWPEVLRLGMAFAAAKLGQFGPNLPSRQEVCQLAERIQVKRITE